MRLERDVGLVPFIVAVVADWQRVDFMVNWRVLQMVSLCRTLGVEAHGKAHSDGSVSRENLDDGWRNRVKPDSAMRKGKGCLIQRQFFLVYRDTHLLDT